MTTYNPLHLIPLPPHPSDPKPLPTAVTIDPFSDLLWIGTSSGNVAAHCSPLTLTPNVRFPAHGSQPNAFMGGGMTRGVTRIRVTDREVWTLTEGGIGGRRRGGAPKWNVSDPTRGLRSMSPNPINSHEVLAGGLNGLMVANTVSGDIVRRVDMSSAIVHLAPTFRNVFSASLSGQLSILDPRTGFKPSANIRPAQAHSGGLNGADVQGNLICTWGWTHKGGHPLADTNVRLYDIRTLRALPAVTFPAGPAFCLLHPTDPSKMIISSQQGMIQTMDLSTGSPGSFQQLDVNSFVTSMALSPAGDYLAFGDADGQVHLWTTNDVGETAPRNQDGTVALPSFNGYSGVKPEWPDADDVPPAITWDEKTPLNLIGMPYYTEPLLSNFPESDYAPVTSPFFNPPEPIPQSVLATMKMVDFVGYATTPKEIRGKRYVVSARPGAGKYATGKGYTNRRESAPKFRSEKDRKGRQSVSGELEEEVAPGQIPKYYRKVEIKYSKFGIEDFDFGFYNRTHFSGLETDILNSYTNSLLQALHYTAPIRNVAKGHICVDCKKENCLLCEAGFLFRMLEDAQGTNCQASNFSRAFSATPQAGALGLLVDNDKAKLSYGSLIQNCNRWLLSTFSAEAVVSGKTLHVRSNDFSNLTLDNPPSAVDQVLGLQLTTTNTCSACEHVISRQFTVQTVDLTYPRKLSETPSFGELLRLSIMRESSTRAACASCRQFVPLVSHRRLTNPSSKGLPAIISVNAMVSSSEIFEVWKDKTVGKTTQNYMPSQVAFMPTPDGDLVADESGVVYNVKSMVVQIQESPDTAAHLVSFVKMPAEDDGDPRWAMFNDFLVRYVSEEEVFRFPDQWKTPAVIILEREDSDALLDFSSVPTQLEPSVLFKDVSVAWNRRKNMIKHKVLDPSELPKPGTLIAIDAEFVALQQEEMEFRSDGTKNILRPSHMSLARVSVLRGQGPKERVPFIDDYIHTSETVVDYLTEFSGIKNGDLDPNNSPHTLVPLKVAYKKLRLLVDLGCIFIGHGLSKDFRTINIHVPPEQVMDTVNIYSVPGQRRKLSLRFLSWFLLKKDIQTTTHDSIEDARYALLLYKLYKEFEAEGRFEDVMEDIFVEGQKLGFKPPQDRISSPAPTPPPKQRAHPSHHQNQHQIPTQPNWKERGGMGERERDGHPVHHSRRRQHGPRAVADQGNEGR